MKPWAIGVEDAHQVGIHPAIAVISHHQRLGIPLGLVVNRAGADRVYVAPIILWLRMLKRIAVALRGGGVQKTGVILRRDLKSIFDSHRPHAQRLDPQPKILWGAGRGSQVENVIHGTRIERLADIALFKLKTRLLFSKPTTSCCATLRASATSPA